MFCISMIQGPYSLAHILYLILILLFLGTGLFFVKKKVKKEKTLTIIIRCSALVLLLTVITKLVSDLIEDGEVWYHVFPATFCSFAGVTLSLTVLFGKKDNPALHFVFYLSLFGGHLTTFYPDFLNHRVFFSAPGLAGLLHHSLQAWLCLLLLTNGYFHPSLKKIIYFIIGFGIMLLWGTFEIYVLKYKTAMNINEPLLSDLPVLTSWYFLYLFAVIAVIAFILIYKLINKKRVA